MKTEYTPVQGQGFVRPGETEKPCYRVFSGIKKAAPIRSRLSEQLTCCEKNGSVQGNYINRVTKRHNCRITGKTKATRYGGPSTQATRYPQRMSITNNATFAAGGQCYQSGLVRRHACNVRSLLEYSLRYFSRANAHGANFSCTRLPVAISRCFSSMERTNFCNSFSVIVHSCEVMRRSSSHHDAGGFYPLGSMPRCCNSLRSTRLIQVANEVSPSALAASSSCALNSSGSRIWYGGDRFSNGVDMVITLAYYSYMVITIVLTITQKTTPRSGGAHAGRLTNNAKELNVMAVRQHTPRPAHIQTAFVWRFIALSTAQPRVIHIEATSEQEARPKNQLIATARNGYDSCAPHKTGAGISLLKTTEAHSTRPACFFVPHSHTLSMVGCTGAEQSAPVSSVSGKANPVQSATSEISLLRGGYLNHTEEAAIMATIPALVHSQTAFLWRFIIFGASERQIIHVTAWTEREARNRCPSGCVAVFAARIRQGVSHA